MLNFVIVKELRIKNSKDHPLKILMTIKKPQHTSTISYINFSSETFFGNRFIN